MPEHEQLIRAYEHLDKLPRAVDALHSLRKIASLVKPIMRNRGWHVGVLTEFYPAQRNLLGLNVNRGQKICLRLRYPGDERQFLPVEEVIDTMLHELSHIVHGPHNENFHSLWNALRDEYQDLILKGYTGEGFLSEGQRLGGRFIPIQEMRREARAAAERRKVLTKNSGQRLGGGPIRGGVDMRCIIADAASKRIERTKGITQGCASGTQEADTMADQASRNGFRTKAEEEDANDRAIAQALWELVQADEGRKAGLADDEWRSDGLKWTPEDGLQPARGDQQRRAPDPPSVTRPAIKDERSLNTIKAASVPYYSKPPAPASRIEQNELKVSSLQKWSQTSAKKRSFSPINTEPTTSPAATTSSSWSCPFCTLVNPFEYLCCDACGSERPIRTSMPTESSALVSAAPENSKSRAELQRKSKTSNLLHPSESLQRLTATTKLGWNCRCCGTFMESQWWTCSLCGVLKAKS